MTIKTVLRMGSPSLQQPSKKVGSFNTPELNQLIQDMWDTMQAENGAGLAAPQIGVNLQVVIFGFKDNPRYVDAPEVPTTVLINPEINPLSSTMDHQWEGCLSLPGMRGRVPRYTHIHYRGFDAQGQLIDREVEGFHARVVQHECDHLDGILYPQRIQDMAEFGFREELEMSDRIQSQPCDD